MLHGDLSITPGNRAIVLFAHGSGSNRHSPRNRYVAEILRGAGLATFLVDLLTTAEEREDEATGRLRFDIEMLADRLVGAIRWLGENPATADLRVGLFGASTGGAAAIVAAARDPVRIGAVVARGGRPDLAAEYLAHERVPTQLIVGEQDETVLLLNQTALQQLGSEVKSLAVVPGAGHLFEEPGALEQVARLSADWFGQHLGTSVTE